MNSQEAAQFFSTEARKQIDILNAGRRNGSISPELDRQMMGQINHLLSLANEARNSPSGPSAPAQPAKPKNSKEFDAASREVAEFTRKARVTPSRESRVEGAPSGDIGVEPEARPARKSRPSKPSSPTNDTAYGDAASEMAEFTRDAVRNARPGVSPEPLSQDERDLESFRRDAATESEAYREGYTVPQPGSDSWDAQGRNLDRSRGMSERDVQHSDRQRRYRQGAYDQMARGQMNPQQPLDLGTAEDQEQWDKWVRSSPSRQERYDPQSAAARQAAEDEKRYDRIASEYGPGEAAAVRAADMNGTVHIPMTPGQKAKSEYRRNLEVAARHQGSGSQVVMGPDGKPIEIPVSKARAELQEMDGRQAASNKAFRAKAKEAAAVRQAEREADPRYVAWRNQMMLAGGRPTGGIGGSKAAASAMGMLPPEQQAQALQYWAAGGRGATPLDVQQANAEAAMQIARGAAFGAGANPAAAAAQDHQIRMQAAEYADRVWNALPYYERTEARRAQLVADVENRYPKMGAVAAGLPVTGRGTPPPPPDTGTIPGGM